jgi:PAS domain-containing protein
MTTDCSALVFDGLARDLFEGYPAPTLIVDDDIRVLALNRAAREMLGDSMTPHRSS